MAQYSQESPSVTGVAAEIEPLDKLARFSWDWAPLLYDPAHGCGDYHRCWSLVRLLQKRGVLPAGIDFFQRQFASLVNDDRRRVLISGSADTGLMALVYSAFTALKATPEIVLVDRCKTTVMQNRILANYLGLEADIRQGDIRAIDCEPVDAVIAHSFLTFFPEPARQQVIDAWGRVLSVGGKVLMSTTIAQHDKVEIPSKDEAKIIASKPQLIERAQAAGMTEVEAKELGEIAVSMLKKRLTHDPQLTTEYLARAFSLAGIDLTEATLKEKQRLGPLAAFRLQSDLIQRGEVVGIRK